MHVQWGSQGGQASRTPSRSYFPRFHAVFFGKLDKHLGWHLHLWCWRPLPWTLDLPLVCVQNSLGIVSEGLVKYCIFTEKVSQLGFNVCLLDKKLSPVNMRKFFHLFSWHFHKVQSLFFCLVPVFSEYRYLRGQGDKKKSSPGVRTDIFDLSQALSPIYPISIPLKNNSFRMSWKMFWADIFVYFKI